MKNSLLDGMVGTSNHTYSYLVRIPHVCSPGCYARSGSPLNVGDLLNFLSAIFFEIHMLRTEHISGSTKKENFFAILGYDVCVVALLSKIWVFIGGLLDGTDYSNQSPWTWTELWDWIVAFQWIPAIYTGAFSTGLCLRIEKMVKRKVISNEFQSSINYKTVSTSPVVVRSETNVTDYFK
ncbi:hypothetical protein EV1_015749 [Malus domestica]